MDNSQKKKPKKGKTKKKPLKVVYISNPMKFKTSASEFMALVQELTGRDSELPDPTKFVGSVDLDDDDVGESNQTVIDASSKSSTNRTTVDDHVDPINRDKPERPDAAAPPPPFGSFDDDEDVFMSPLMFDNFSVGTALLPSSLLYGSNNVDVLRSLDAI